ncbi:MAG TPA: cyclic nucleotide-binding domain-containing protein, partial [Gaiellaceae bacterium]
MNVSEPGHSAAEILERVPVLRLLPEDARRLVSESFVPVSFGFGEVVVEEGSEADSFYVIVEGAARVLKRAESGEELPLGS